MVIKDNFIKLICIVLLTNALTISCQNIKMEQKFDWSATLSAPEEYPVQVYKGEIIAKDYSQSLSGFGDIDYGWGEEGGTVVMGPDFKNIPDSLEIAWHSFVDQKNFEGKWALPKEEITKLFEEGFIDDFANKKLTYTTFVVGLAPNGLVVVWLSGAGNQIEVAHFKAQEVFVNIENISDRSKPIFSKKYNDIVLSELNEKHNTFERIKQKDYPKIEVYEKYRKKYLWKPSIVLLQDCKLNNLMFHFYNGEINNTIKENLASLDYNEKAVFKKCYFHWIDKNQKRRGAWIEEFNQEELYDAYEALGEEAQIDLIIKIIEPNTVVILLKNNDKEIEIKKYKKTIE